MFPCFVFVLNLKTCFSASSVAGTLALPVILSTAVRVPVIRLITFLTPCFSLPLPITESRPPSAAEGVAFFKYLPTMPLETSLVTFLSTGTIRILGLPSGPIYFSGFLSALLTVIFLPLMLSLYLLCPKYQMT